MAELEVAKHTKKVFKIFGSKEGWWHKLKEIIFEVAIIVFAVSLSIWLHNRSEKNHDREEAKLFLEGLKTDLQSDITQMEGDLVAYDSLIKSSAYFQSIAFKDSLNKDSLNVYKRFLYNSTQMNPNGSRFEGFKVSGKLNTIENKNLLNDILYFYQHNMVFLNMLNTGFNNYKKERLGLLLDQKLVFDKNGNANWEQVLRQPEIQNVMRRINSREVLQTIEEYNAAIVTAQRIITTIDKESD